MNSKIQDLSNKNILVLPQLRNDIETLYADNNSLTSLSQLPCSIQVISAMNNKLNFLPDLGQQVPSLTILNLSNNKLVSIRGLCGSKNLQELIICNNFIGDEEILSLKSLQSLKFLDVSRNHLRSPNFIKILQSLPNLEELRNNHNEFEAFKIEFKMENLKTLTLENNKLLEIQFDQPLTSLEKLLCKQNKITYIGGLRNLKNLRELDISENNLNEIPEGLDKTQVSILLCNNNSLSTLPYLPTLEILDASNNSLLRIMKFGGKIQEVILVNNHLKNLPDMGHVLSVNVAYNQFTSLEWARNCRSLQCLDAGFNPIEVPGTVLQDLMNVSLRSLVLPEPLSEDFKELIVNQLSSLTEINKEIIPFRSFVSDKSNFRGSNYWDALSKSKLFPSCRSSMTGLTTPINVPNTYNSLFSDFKPSPLTNNEQLSRYEVSKEEVTGRFSTEKLDSFNPTKLENTVKLKNTENLPLQSKERNRSVNRIQTKSNRKKRICTKPNCKKHRKADLNKSALVDQCTSPFVSQDFYSLNSNKNNYSEQKSILDRTARVLNDSTKVYLNQSKLGNTLIRRTEEKQKNLAHLFGLARTPPRPVLTNESAVPIIAKISSVSYEYSLVKELLYLEGYNLSSLSKTYTYSLHKSLEKLHHNSSTPKDFYLLFYFNTPEILQTIFSYYKGFEYLYERESPNSIIFSLSITRTTSILNPTNKILLCLCDPSTLSTSDNHLFHCSSPSSIIPIYLIDY